MRTHFTAFLDLVCCGFGSGVLLFLIAVASVREHPDVIRDDTLLVLCTRHEGARAEVGIELLPPGETQWVRPVAYSGKAPFYSVESGPDAGSEAFVIVSEPTCGVWKFRPFLVDFADPANPSLEGRQTVVSLTVYGRDQDSAVQGDFVAMTLPGDYGQSITVPVSE